MADGPQIGEKKTPSKTRSHAIQFVVLPVLANALKNLSQMSSRSW
jgi:hypothetical protein